MWALASVTDQIYFDHSLKDYTDGNNRKCAIKVGGILSTIRYPNKVCRDPAIHSHNVEVQSLHQGEMIMLCYCLCCIKCQVAEKITRNGPRGTVNIYFKCHSSLAWTVSRCNILVWGKVFEWTEWLRDPLTEILWRGENKCINTQDLAQD